MTDQREEDADVAANSPKAADNRYKSFMDSLAPVNAESGGVKPIGEDVDLGKIL